MIVSIMMDLWFLDMLVNPELSQLLIFTSFCELTSRKLGCMLHRERNLGIAAVFIRVTKGVGMI